MTLKEQLAALLGINDAAIKSAWNGMKLKYSTPLEDKRAHIQTTPPPLSFPYIEYRTPDKYGIPEGAEAAAEPEEPVVYLPFTHSATTRRHEQEHVNQVYANTTNPRMEANYSPEPWEELMKGSTGSWGYRMSPNEMAAYQASGAEPGRNGGFSNEQLRQLAVQFERAKMGLGSQRQLTIGEAVPLLERVRQTMSNIERIRK